MEINIRAIQKAAYFIDRQVENTLSREFESDLPEDQAYLLLLRQVWHSMKTAFGLDPEIAYRALNKGVQNIVKDAKITNRGATLATFYDLILEKPKQTNRILSYGAFYTLASAFAIAYHHYSDPEVPKETLKYASSILSRTLYDIRKELNGTRAVDEA